MTLLGVRNRLGRSVVDCVLSDFDTHGPEAVQTLRQADPGGFGKVLTDLLALRERLRAEAGDTVKRASGRAARSRRSRMASKLLAALEADFTLHGAETVAILRETRPQAWARLLAEVCQFKLVPKTPQPAPRRQPRPVRMKNLVAQMQVPPTVDLDDPALPPDRMEELLRVTGEVGADRLAAMGLEGLLQHLPDVMALWFWRWMGAGKDGRSAPDRASAPAGDWFAAFRDAPRDEVAGNGFTLRR